jgi:hypothetical protein
MHVGNKLGLALVTLENALPYRTLVQVSMFLEAITNVKDDARRGRLIAASFNTSSLSKT